ncbi:MAG: hypothetical protein WD468_04400 [Pirellulales bacterium]
MKQLHNTIWAFAVLFCATRVVAACPFCSVQSQTLSEETQAADAVVLAKLVKEAAPTASSTEGSGELSSSTGMATFKVMEVIRGESAVKSGQEIDVVYFGPADHEQIFMITGIGTDQIDWITPLPLSAAAVEYARKLPSVPASGADRLAFFQDYLEHEDPLLAQDAYDEFGGAPFSELQELKPRLYHDRLVKWVLDPEVSPSRRRLYFVLLGICGNDADLPMLEEMIVSNYATKQPFVEELVHTGLAMGGPIGLPAWVELVKLDERRKKLGLDALIGSYVLLRGPDGLDLVDEQFLKNPGVEYTYIYSAVMALRTLGDEPSTGVPKERLFESMRLLLDNPDFADQVPIDLSRWSDWSVLDRLVEMYKKSDKNAYIRQPVVSYLTVASEVPGDVGTRATTALEELEKLDPEGVKQARSLAAFGALARARASAPANTGTTDGTAGTASDTNETVAQSGATDATQGFAASAADLAAEAESQPGEIPDPAEFDGQAAKEEGSEKPPAADQTVDQGKSPAADSAEPQVLPVLDRPLVIGVPLAAAAVLMGVYWVILRFGAV